MRTQTIQVELPRNVSFPWLSLGFVGCLEMLIENESDKKPVDIVDNSDSPALATMEFVLSLALPGFCRLYGNVG